MRSLTKITDVLWEVPQTYKDGMRVPGRIYASEAMLSRIVGDNCLEQVANVACLPGIQSYSLAMPDIHWGYGFPIGGVAATAPDEGGVISPGGVGYDINCGVRLMRTNLTQEEVAPRIHDLVGQLFRDIPCGLGEKSDLRLTRDDEHKVLLQGAHWAVAHGFGSPGDTEFIEENGCMAEAEASNITERALERGAGQVGSLGSGNHFVEVQVTDEIYDETAANTMGLFLGGVTVMIHCGSRGFGYQVCDDYLRVLGRATEKYDFRLPDRQLASAPINSPEGQEYLAAMRCAANYAFANRQVLGSKAAGAFLHALRISPDALGMQLVYDVPHNIAKFEEHVINGKTRRLCVHRKGATRSFPPHHPLVPPRYRAIGQPVLVPGDMGRYSFVLVGRPQAMAQTFGTVCHGAGRVMSRSQAKRELNFDQLRRDMEQRGVVMMARGRGTAVEEASAVYKDVAEVVNVVDSAGLAKKVCRLRPIGVVKG
ncbi:MAG: RtcB family protein [Verrucomicrobia bacterium]|nr:RtcB family protein [Verrucomicrobiota bacterium]